MCRKVHCPPKYIESYKRKREYDDESHHLGININAYTVAQATNTVAKKRISNWYLLEQLSSITLSDSSAVKTTEGDVQIDPQLLFQRLVTLGNRQKNLSEAFQFELCSFPPALFQSKYMPRQLGKSQLADELWIEMPKKGMLVYLYKFLVPWSSMERNQDFLANKENKQQFITLLDGHLRRYGCRTEHASAYADLLIVWTANSTTEIGNKPTVLHGSRYILILRCYHWESAESRIFLKPETRYGTKKQPRYWDISVVKSTLVFGVCDNILLVHAFLGCDTTSH